MHTRTGYSFAIADENDVAVGQIGLCVEHECHGCVSVGYWIRPSARNRGYAADAIDAVVDWARTLGQLHRLELYVEPWNEGSWRAAERAGFQREGRHERRSARQGFQNATQLLNAGSKPWRRILCPMKVRLTDTPEALWRMSP
ncbi:N-acetyltransferase [Cryobacterium sp. TMT2-15-1]|uniref:GNAT family N-acetyltransferase n=1 Tax=Cryobacterium sp. TMT2-15-1 TaxID=1259246 RepID=UPI00106B4917|nr:N-acetyltransferase [Cryobacterium sp. TMT2-15-1]